MSNSCILVFTSASRPFLYMFGLLATTTSIKLKVSTISISSVNFYYISSYNVVTIKLETVINNSSTSKLLREGANIHSTQI